MYIRYPFLICLLCVFLQIGSANAILIFKNGKIVNSDNVPTMTQEEHFYTGLNAMDNGNWQEAVKHLYIVTFNFPDTSFGQDSFYYLGLAYYNLQELDFSNDAFTEYLKRHKNPQHYEDAVAYKLDIAKQLRAGVKRRLLNGKYLPKWMPGDALASEICDQIVAAMPCHEMSAEALDMKAEYLWEQCSYRASIDTYQQLIRRFPKHELALQSYLAISKVYLDQGHSEVNNADILEFAQMNLTKFQLAYPNQNLLIAQVQEDFQAIQECYAHSLYETGLFYERVNHPGASAIYYRSAMSRFPETKVAWRCQQRLHFLTNTGNPESMSSIEKQDGDASS